MLRRECSIGVWLGLVPLFLSLALAQSAPAPLMFQLKGGKGSIDAKTTRDDLVRLFGKENVVDREVDVGEGETAPGTVVFPDDPERSVDLQWKNPDARDTLRFVTVRGKSTRWKTIHDIGLGTSLKELERINGRPFHMSGFGWDYSGTVYSWDGGLLQQELEGKGRLLLRLDSAQQNVLSDKEQAEVMGDRDFSSHHLLMQKLNPTVYEMLWELP